MKYSTIIKFTALLMFPLFLWGCFEDHGAQFHLDDINQVEWAPPNKASSSLSYTAELEAGQTDTESVVLEVQLIGAQTNSARTVGVTVSDTDATDGVHFEILSNEVTIPENSNHGTVEVRILAANIDDGESYSVTLELQEGPELGVAVNMKDMNLSIEKSS